MNKIKDVLLKSKSLHNLIENFFDVKIDFNNRQSYIRKILFEKLPKKLQGSQMNYVAKSYKRALMLKGRVAIYDGMIEIISKHVSKDDKRNILDLGCGEGILLYFMSKKFPDKKIYGIDIAPAMVAEAKKLNKGNKNVMILKKDIFKLKKDFFVKNKIGIITIKNVLSRLEDPFLFLKKLRKFCSNGTLILITDLRVDTIPWKIVQRGFLETLGKYKTIDRLKGWAGCFKKNDLDKIFKIFKNDKIYFTKFPPKISKKLRKYLKYALFNILIEIKN